VSTHWVFGRSVLLLPIPTSHIDLALAQLRWSILSAASTFALEAVSHCHEFFGYTHKIGRKIKDVGSTYKRIMPQRDELDQLCLVRFSNRDKVPQSVCPLLL